MMIDDYSSEFNKTIDHFKQELGSIKTGRANPVILDSVVVEAYGVKTPLNQLSSITVPEARNLVIQPWDKNIIKDVEKAIHDSNLGLNPVNEGDRLRITLPQLTEESRLAIVKMLNQKMEEARIAIRNIRDEIKEAILKAEENKEFGEDKKYELIDQLNKTVGEYNDRIKKIGEDKEEDIMKI